MIEINDNKYRLIFLDTNALREIVNHSNLSGKGFFERFYNENKSNRDNDFTYAPCFSIYSVFELKPYVDIFEKFLDFFSTVPTVMFFANKNILEEEVLSYLNNVKFDVLSKNMGCGFSRLGINFREFINNIFFDEKLTSTVQEFIDDLPDVASAWQQQRVDAKQRGVQIEVINNYHKLERKAIVQDFKRWGIEVEENLDIKKLFGARLRLYSQFFRVHKTEKKIDANDVLDVEISCIMPYVDAIITEAFQAEVCKQAKRFLPIMKNVEIFVLKDIRQRIGETK